MIGQAAMGGVAATVAGVPMLAMNGQLDGDHLMLSVVSGVLGGLGPTAVHPNAITGIPDAGFGHPTRPEGAPDGPGSAPSPDGPSFIADGGRTASGDATVDGTPIDRTTSPGDGGLPGRITPEGRAADQGSQTVTLAAADQGSQPIHRTTTTEHNGQPATTHTADSNGQSASLAAATEHNRQPAAPPPTRAAGQQHAPPTPAKRRHAPPPPPNTTANQRPAPPTPAKRRHAPPPPPNTTANQRPAPPTKAAEQQHAPPKPLTQYQINESRCTPTGPRRRPPMDRPPLVTLWRERSPESVRRWRSCSRDPPRPRRRYIASRLLTGTAPGPLPPTGDEALHRRSPAPRSTSLDLPRLPRITGLVRARRCRSAAGSTPR
ncbi:hypothetical protein ACFQX6_52400 [Streptosporangium lutulentum]